MAKIYYGWYSGKAAMAGHRTFGYRSVATGEEVRCTEVSATSECGSMWGDEKCLGEVGEFLREFPSMESSKSTHLFVFTDEELSKI